MVEKMLIFTVQLKLGTKINPFLMHTLRQFNDAFFRTAAEKLERKESAYKAWEEFIPSK